MSIIRSIVAVALSTVCLAGAVDAQENEAPADTAGTVQPVVEIAFGTDVDREARTIIGEAETFPADLGTVWCWTRIQGLTPPVNVRHVWYYEGKTMARVDLKVGSPDWRTWSSKRFLPAWTGHWEVKVLDEAGRVLASGGFDIE